MQVHGKIRVLGGGGGVTKNQYIGGLPKKGVWTICRFKGGGLAKKRVVVFLMGVNTPMHTMWPFNP